MIKGYYIATCEPQKVPTKRTLKLVNYLVMACKEQFMMLSKKQNFGRPNYCLFNLFTSPMYSSNLSGMCGAHNFKGIVLSRY